MNKFVLTRISQATGWRFPSVWSSSKKNHHLIVRPTAMRLSEFLRRRAFWSHAPAPIASSLVRRCILPRAVFRNLSSPLATTFESQSHDDMSFIRPIENVFEPLMSPQSIIKTSRHVRQLSFFPKIKLHGNLEFGIYIANSRRIWVLWSSQYVYPLTSSQFMITAWDSNSIPALERL